MENFKFSMPLNIRWNDMDPLGHVNNVYYIDYFQNARAYYMVTASNNWDWNRYMFVIAHVECDYFVELGLKAKNPMIHVRASRLGSKSFDFEYLIGSEGKDGKTIIHAQGKTTQVMIDIHQKTSIEIPEWLRNDLMEFEPGL